MISAAGLNLKIVYDKGSIPVAWDGSIPREMAVPDKSSLSTISNIADWPLGGSVIPDNYVKVILINGYSSYIGEVPPTNKTGLTRSPSAYLIEEITKDKNIDKIIKP